MYIKSARFYTGKIKKRFFFRGKILFFLYCSKPLFLMATAFSSWNG